MTGPIPLGLPELAAAASLILVNGLLSLWLGLGLEKRLLVASVRTVVQLLILGAILVPVFRWEHPGPVVAMGMLMVMLAAWEAIRRTARRFRGMYGAALTSMLVGAGGTALLGTAAIVGVDPWWQPQYFIPLLGMILGNALTGISLGLDRTMDMLDDGRGRVETRLAWGATAWEAARPVAAEALRTGMIPIINSMSAVGLVTIPGMMTGQILSGTAPALAARYQILIMFLVAGATALGTALSVLLTVRVMFDREHRLRIDKLRKVSG